MHVNTLLILQKSINIKLAIQQVLPYKMQFFNQNSDN